MKPDTYFRHAGRSPCTANAIAGNVSDSPLTSSSSATDAWQDQHSGGTPVPLTDGVTASAGPSSSPQRRRGRPNTCTANTTDASGSAEPPFDSSAETEGAPQTPTPSPQPKHGEITSHGASSAQPKKRGRPRKSP